MRKRFFMMILAFVLALPGVFLLTACGENGSSTQKEITDLYIKKDGWAQKEQWVGLEYGDTISKITEGMSLVFRYSDGSEIEFNEHNFSEEEFQRIGETYRENYYFSDDYGVNYSPYAGSTYQNTILDVGKYKIEISLNQKTAIIKVDVEPAQIESKNIAVVVLPNANNNYQSKINQSQTYKYGMPVAGKSGLDDEEYTSDYKLYVLDRDKNNQIISGTDVKEVMALPETFDGGTSCGDEFADLEVGDNLLDYYNAINEDTEQETFEKKQYFLSAYGKTITTGYNYSDNTLIVRTEALKPGNYLMYVHYENKNYNDFYTEPTTQLVVEKGVFDLKKAIRYKNQDWSEADAEEILSKVVVSVDYTFNAGAPMFNSGNTKALTAKYLNDNYFVTSNVNATSAGEVFENVDFEVAGGGYTGIFGKFKLLEKNQFNQDIRFDATDNGSTSAKFVFAFDSDWMTEYYEEDPTIYGAEDFTIEMNINKGQVYRPYCGTEDTLEREYTGETITIVGDNGIIVRDPNAVTHTGTTSATAINIYTATFSLIDDVNYEFFDVGFDVNYGENGTFTWKITKLDLDGQWGEDGFTTKTISYNETEQVNSYEITYVSGVRTITLALSGNSKYDLLLTKLPGRHITWSINTDQTFQVVGAQVSQESGSDVAIITFTGLEDGTNYGYIHLGYSIAETAYSEALNVENAVQIIINKADFTEEQETAILDAIGAEKYEDEYQATQYRLKAESKIIVSNVDMNLPNDVLPDYSDEDKLPETAVYGTWHLYYEDDGQVYEKHNGDHLSSTDTMGWRFVFVPADDMYNGYEVYLRWYDDADMEFVNEDIPADVLSGLQSEAAACATITKIFANSTGYGSYEDFLPEHDNDAEGAFQGRWALYYDTPSGGEYEMSNRGQYSYYEGVDEDYIKSESRQWKLKFIPMYGYNTLEISVNVTFNA